MRFRLPMRRAILFASLFALGAIVVVPMRLVLGALDGGLTAREVSGTIWSGALKEARVGPASLGDLDARLSPLPLLIGRVRVSVERGRAGPDWFAGAFELGRDRRSAESVTGNLQLAPLGGLPIASLDLTDVTIRFRDGACDQAQGLVRANLAGDVAGLPLPGGLSGTVRCDRGALLLPLASGAGGEGVELRIAGDGRYEARLSLRASEPALVARLTGAGFAAGPGGYALTLRGRF